jgi:hypothetical protein
MSVDHIERISCDNPDCVVYADELIREFPGQFELRDYARSLVATSGWVTKGDLDFCPTHVPLSPLAV